MTYCLLKHAHASTARPTMRTPPRFNARIRKCQPGKASLYHTRRPNRVLLSARNAPSRSSHQVASLPRMRYGRIYCMRPMANHTSRWAIINLCAIWRPVAPAPIRTGDGKTESRQMSLGQSRRLGVCCCGGHGVKGMAAWRAVRRYGCADSLRTGSR
jgi:hypothetical protein